MSREFLIKTDVESYSTEKYKEFNNPHIEIVSISTPPLPSLSLSLSLSLFLSDKVAADHGVCAAHGTHVSFVEYSS